MQLISHTFAICTAAVHIIVGTQATLKHLTDMKKYKLMTAVSMIS